MDPSSFGKKLFSFGKRSTKSEKVLKQKTQDKELVQEIQLFAESSFTPQDYVNEYYNKQTPDKAPLHIDKLQGLLTNTNDLLKAYVYSNHIAFVHASNRTLQVENDVVLLNSLLNNLKLTISTLPNENIMVESLSEQSSKQTINVSILGGNDNAQNTFWLSEHTTTASIGANMNANPNTSFASMTSSGGTFGIGGLYDKNNLMRIRMYKHGQTPSEDDGTNLPIQMPSIKDKYSKYIENLTTAKFKDEGGAVIQSLNNINISINETINLVELSEDLQALIFERRLSEAVTLVELLVILGVLPPILQFDQSLIDRVNNTGAKNYLDEDSDESDDDRNFGYKSTPAKARPQPVKQRTFGSTNQIDEQIDPKTHYTSLDYVDNRLLNIKGPNPAHTRHRLAMTSRVLHENTSNLTNPPNFTRYSTTTSAINNQTALFAKSTLQLQHEAANRQLLSESELDHEVARVYDNSQELSTYNDGRYTFQPMLNLPVFPNSVNAPINTTEIATTTEKKRSSAEKQLDFNTLYSLTPTPTTFSSIYGFGKQPPPPTWRLSHQIDALQTQSGHRSKNKAGVRVDQNSVENVITVKENKVIRNTNVTHYYTKQTKISTHLGKLVTVLVSLLLDELTHYVGTSWEQDERLLLLSRLNQQHLALHRFLLIQSNLIQEQLKKSRYKGDLRLFTLSICQIVFGAMQTTIRDFKRIFCHPDNNQPPTSSLPTSQQAGGTTTTTSTTTTTTNSSSTTTSTMSMTTTILTPHNTYTYLRDDLLAHLSTWILLEITRLGRLIDQQLLHSHNKFQDFPNCINAVYEASLEIEQTLGTTTCNILVQCLHPSIVRTINDIAFLLEKNINELLQRDDWSPVSLNFTLVPISLQTPKDLLAKEAVEMIEANQRVLQVREQRNTLIADFKSKQRELRRKEKELTKAIEKMAKLKAGQITEDDKDKDKDSDDDDEFSTLHAPSLLGLDSSPDGDKNKELEKVQKALKELQPPKLPELSTEEDVVFEKIRLHIASSSAAVYKSLLLFSKQLLSVLLCPIWRISQQSIETVAIDALCCFIDRLVKTLASVIRKHLATLFAPLPPDYLDFINSQQSSTTQSSAMRLHQQANDTTTQDKKEKQINTQLLPSQPVAAPTKTSLVYKAGSEDHRAPLSGQEIHSIAVSLQNQGPAKKQFKPLNEVQLSVILNSLSFISHYVFPYISLFISVNLCKPIPELLNACYKQKKMTLSAFEHVTKKKAQFFLRGRWYVQQDLQYRELLDQQQQLIKRLTLEGKTDELLLHQDSIIPPPTFKEDHDNLNTLHLPFNGALFWADSGDIHQRYITLPEFPTTPSLTSITNHMLSFLIHIYQQCHSYSLVLTPHQSKYMLRLLVDETCAGLLQTTGWETIFPTTNSALYMICDIKVMLYFCYALFGIIEDTKNKREQIIRRIVRIYAKQYIVRAQAQTREQAQKDKEIKRHERTKMLEKMQEGLDRQTKDSKADENGPEVSKVGKTSTKKAIDTDGIEFVVEESSDDDEVGDGKKSPGSASSASKSSSSTTTTVNGKKVTKTTTTTTSSSSSDAKTVSTQTSSSSESAGKDRIADPLNKPLGLAQSSAILAASTLNSKPLSMVTMDDLNNDVFLAERLREIDLGTDYYKMVAKQLLEYCGKHYLQTIQNYNLQDINPNKPQNQPKDSKD